MGEVMNFTSQISTTKEQSEQLLALGLKAETADMCYQIKFFNPFPHNLVDCDPLLLTHPPLDNERFIPAWSLARLFEMLPSFIDIGGFAYMLRIIQGKLFSYRSDIAGHALLYGKANVYASAIYTIKWLIEEGHFNKEYLKEN